MSPHVKTVPFKEMQSLMEKRGFSVPELVKYLGLTDSAYYYWQRKGRVLKAHVNRLQEPFTIKKLDLPPAPIADLAAYKLTDPADLVLLINREILPKDWKVAVMLRNDDNVSFTKVS